ncbi:non-canonical purine NTP pyrophosphatase [bacterium]|nr:non-canonical purine NTP pyrophosphatase [bacterium]
MNRLLIATTNPAKLAEYRLLLRGYGLQVLSLADFAIDAEAPENAPNFAENALLKARFYFARAQVATLADDGGLEVDALGGAPGVRSHRWLGESADDRRLADEIIRRMRGVEPRRRTARLRAAAALIFSDAGAVRERVVEAALDGVIPDRRHERVRPGFPYRAVLFLPDRGCYLGELGEEEEARISQRRALVRQLDADLRRLAAAGSD